LKTSDAPFQLEFAPARLRHFSDRYNYADDTEPLDAGHRIACSDYTRANLEIIFRWKTGSRGISRLARNSDEEVRDAPEPAINARTERASVAVLCGLSGVGIPVASAILICIDPLRYTILDFRALEAPGITDHYETIDFYLLYMAHRRDLAVRHAISLRDLDRALWQWSKDKSPS
jgi:hypothetical protein